MSNKNNDLEPEDSRVAGSPAITNPLDKPKQARIGGKKKGWRKVDQTLKNGKYTKDDIFNYVPKHTIPTSDLDRYINLCDAMIKDLGSDSVSESDLEEITLYYRDRIYCDKMYESFAQADGVMDSTMVLQLEKLNKGLEQRKTNLGSRFIDRGKKRKESNVGTLMELIGKYVEDKKSFEIEAGEKQLLITQNKKHFTNTADYMEDHIGSTINLIKEED